MSEKTRDVKNDVKNNVNAVDGQDDVVDVKTKPKAVYCDHKQILARQWKNGMTQDMMTQMDVK